MKVTVVVEVAGVPFQGTADAQALIQQALAEAFVGKLHLGGAATVTELVQIEYSRDELDKRPPAL